MCRLGYHNQDISLWYMQICPNAKYLESNIFLSQACWRSTQLVSRYIVLRFYKHRLKQSLFSLSHTPHTPFCLYSIVSLLFLCKYLSTSIFLIHFISKFLKKKKKNTDMAEKFIPMKSVIQWTNDIMSNLTLFKASSFPKPGTQ